MIPKINKPGDVSLSFLDLSLSPVTGIRGSSGLDTNTAFGEMPQKHKTKTAKEAVVGLRGQSLLSAGEARLSGSRSEHMKPLGRAGV